LLDLFFKKSVRTALSPIFFAYPGRRRRME
jgi:hypothetical protein